MASIDQEVDDEWQVNSDTNGHNVVVVFKPTTALAQNITTAVTEIEHSIDYENLIKIAPFSFAEFDLTRTPSISKVVEEYFASYYFKIFSPSDELKNPASSIILPDISPFNGLETGVIHCFAGHWILSKGHPTTIIPLYQWGEISMISHGPRGHRIEIECIPGVVVVAGVNRLEITGSGRMVFLHVAEEDRQWSMNSNFRHAFRNCGLPLG